MVLALSIRRICLNDSFYSVFKVPSPSPFRKLENEFQILSGAHSLMAEGGGGDEGARTPDLLLAKQALSQLSYIPSREMGDSGVEPETFPLSEGCSNQLS